MKKAEEVGIGEKEGKGGIYTPGARMPLSATLSHQYFFTMLTL